MEIIIYETTHSENLSALLELSCSYFSKITVFLKNGAYEQILPIVKKMDLPLTINFQTQKQDEANRPFIKRFFQHVHANTYTHLHINTLDHNLLYFTRFLSKNKDLKISMTVHSINDYKILKFNTLKNITEAFAKVILHKKIQFYRVLAPAMQGYFETNFPNKKAFFIPGNFFDKKLNEENKSKSNPFTILIPGTVEAKRRNYFFVIDFLAKYLNQFNKHNVIQIIFAGNAASAFGNEVVTRLKALENESFKILYYNEELDQDTYNQLYCSANIVWNPIIIDTISIQHIKEKNSVSHSPGFITDQIHFGKSAIVPNGIQVHEILTNCNFFYKTEADLVEIFNNILANPVILEEKQALTAKACEFFKSGNFEKAFNSLINGTP